ncbi:MAG: hypothetical protein GY711_27345 [bacterium]|nr:hypothetical protein [bacterium]
MKNRFAAAVVLATCPAFAQTYSYDNGSTENALSLGINFIPGEIAMLHGFAASGGSDVLTQMQVGVGTALAPVGVHDGRPLTLAVWDDPNDDFDPSDAVLLHQSTVTVTQSNTDLKVSYPLPNVPVTGNFFVGVVMQDMGDFPVGLDLDAGGSPSAWIVGAGPNVPLDLMNLAGAPFGLSSQTNAVFLVSADGGGTTGPIGTNYCGPALPNSTGASAVITATGSAVVANNDLTLTAEFLPVGQFGYFLASETQGFFNPPGSAGFICLAGAIGRFNQASNIIQGPVGSIQVDLTAIPVSPPEAVLIGDVWSFQCWFRDAGGTSNFTDGVSITFL